MEGLLPKGICPLPPIKRLQSPVTLPILERFEGVSDAAGQ